MNLNLKIEDKCKILLENGYNVWITVTTVQSKYQGKSYRLIAASWRARVTRNMPNRGFVNAYYYWDAVKLSDKTTKLFKDLLKKTYIHRDFLKKEICPNNLLFLDAELYKVEIITKNYIYVTTCDSDRNNSYWLTKNIILQGFNSDHYGRCKYFRILKSNSWKFLLLDNPLDILRII